MLTFIQSGASYLSRDFDVLQYQPISRRNFPKHYLWNLATDEAPRSVGFTFLSMSDSAPILSPNGLSSYEWRFLTATYLCETKFLENLSYFVVCIAARQHLFYDVDSVRGENDQPTSILTHLNPRTLTLSSLGSKFKFQDNITPQGWKTFNFDAIRL